MTGHRTNRSLPHEREKMLIYSFPLKIGLKVVLFSLHFTRPISLSLPLSLSLTANGIQIISDAFTPKLTDEEFIDATTLVFQLIPSHTSFREFLSPPLSFFRSPENFSGDLRDAGTSSRFCFPSIFSGLFFLCFYLASYSTGFCLHYLRCSIVLDRIHFRRRNHQKKTS